MNVTEQRALKSIPWRRRATLFRKICLQYFIFEFNECFTLYNTSIDSMVRFCWLSDITITHPDSIKEQTENQESLKRSMALLYTCAPFSINLIENLSGALSTAVHGPFSPCTPSSRNFASYYFICTVSSLSCLLTRFALLVNVACLTNFITLL